MTDSSPHRLTIRKQLGAGLLLGAAAAATNHFLPIPLFTPESPNFFFGGGLVLLAFAAFGSVAGWAAASLQALGMVADVRLEGLIAEPRLILYVGLYLAVPWLVLRIRRYTGGLVLAALLFWMTIGWGLGILLYEYGMGLGVDFFRLVHLKQVLNGIVDAVVAEALLGLVPPGWRKAPERVALRQFAFSRLIQLIFPMLALLAFLYARLAFQDVVREAELAQSLRAAAAANHVRQLVLRASTMERLTDRVELAKARREPVTTMASMLRETRARVPELLNIGLTDSAGIVVAASPDTSLVGAHLVGLDLSDRPYFQESRKTLSTPYAPLVLGTLHIQSKAVEPVLLLSHPLVTGSGQFDGVIVGALDVRTLAPAVSPVTARPSLLTLVDREGRVVVSGDPARAVGESLVGRYPAAILGPPRATRFTYHLPPPLSGPARSSFFHVAWEPVGGSGWAIAAELSADALYPAMASAIHVVIVGLVVLALLLSGVAVLVARRVTDPLLLLDRMAGEVAEGRTVPDAVSRRLLDTPITEIQSLATRLLATRRALTARADEAGARALEQEALFQRAFDNPVVGVAHDGLDGRCVRVNARFCEIIGHPRERLIGATASEIHGDRDRLTPEQKAGLIEGTTSAVVREHPVVRPDGQTLVVRVLTTVHRHLDGTPAVFVVEVEDITVPKALQAQLAESQKMEAIGRLAGGVAHDFNNLLMPILGYTDLVRESLPEGTEARESLGYVTVAAERAGDLTRQLLAFGRGQTLVAEPIDPRRSVAEVAALLRPLVRENVVLHTTVEPGTAWIQADPGQLQQILMNLAVNAVDSMPNGGVLTIEVRNVTLTGPAADQYPELSPGRHVSIVVQDNGEGIPPELLPRIFEPFVTTKLQGKGTGLGLATVYGIVAQQSGAIRVAGAPDGGTRFTILFPALPEDVKSSAEPVVAPSGPTPGGAGTILVAEDEVAVRRLVVTVLEREGYRVIQASSGEEALAQAATLTEPLTALVTDVIMAGMNGRVLSERLGEKSSGLRTLFMSGYAGAVFDQAGIDPATAKLLGKPFTPAELLRALAALLR